MKTIWLRLFGPVYLPVHFMGVVITLLAIIFLIRIYTASARNDHSVSIDLYQMFVCTFCTAFRRKWITVKTRNYAE